MHHSVCWVFSVLTGVQHLQPKSASKPRQPRHSACLVQDEAVRRPVADEMVLVPHRREGCAAPLHRRLVIAEAAPVHGGWQHELGAQRLCEYECRNEDVLLIDETCRRASNMLEHGIYVLE